MSWRRAHRGGRLDLRWLAGFALGCNSDVPDTPPACVEDGLSAEIGTGAAAFEPLADGDDLTMAFGSQGGWHFTTSLRLAGISDIAKLHPRATALSFGAEIAGHQLPENRELTGCVPETCSCEALNLRVFLAADVRADICRLEGEQVEIVVEVTDLATGATTQATRLVTAQLDDGDVTGCHP